MPRPLLRAVVAAVALGVAVPGLAETRINQISLEARVAEVSRSTLGEWGIDWAQPSDQFQAAIINPGVDTTGLAPTPHENLRLIIEALERDSLSQVLANPQIMTLDNGVAEVRLASPVPLPTVNYSQVGIQLKVTPSIVADGVQVTIKIDSGGLTVPPGGLVPIVAERQLDASVLLSAGSALAISGFFPDDMGESAAKVPFLADIPYLGGLFRSRNYQEGRTKPLALVFPYVVGSVEGLDGEGGPVGPVGGPIRLQAALVEASQSTFQDLGIDWLGSRIGTTVLDLSNIAPDASDPQASIRTFIDALNARALTRTLAEPNLVALSDGTREFIAQGTGFPTIEFKRFGVTLSFTPQVSNDDLITLDLAPAVSGLTFPSGGNIPVFETRRSQTSVELRDGETVAIGGLIPDDMAEVENKLPFFGDIPVLGALFRSTDFNRDETELVIIVSSHLVNDDGGSSGSGGSTSSRTAAAQPAQPRSTTEDVTSATATSTVSNAANQTPAEIRQGGRLTGKLAGVAGRIDQNSQFGGGVFIYPDRETFGSQSPGSVQTNGFELSINLDLNQANLFGMPDVVSRLLSSGQPTSKLYASFSRVSGDAEDHAGDSNTALDYGIVFADDSSGEPGLKFLGVDGFGLDSTTRTESTWYRATIGIETEFPNLFGNSRLTLEKDFGVFFEKLDTDFDAETVVLLDDVALPDFASQTTTANTEDRYLGILLGKTLFYALTQRLRVGVGGELSVSHRSSSAEVRQHNVTPTKEFDIVFDYDDSGLALGFGAALIAEYALNDRLHFELAYRRQTLPGVTTLLIPETTSEIPVGATQESATRRAVSFAVSHDF